MEPEILNNILYAVPEALRLEYSDVMEDLLKEVRDDYNESEKRSAGTIAYNDAVVRKRSNLFSRSCPQEEAGSSIRQVSLLTFIGFLFSYDSALVTGPFTICLGLKTSAHSLRHGENLFWRIAAVLKNICRLHILL